MLLIPPNQPRLTTPHAVDIDHIVPLAWAWRHGADKWAREQRISFANDPDNLIVAGSASNRSKGARGPDEWMPANVATWTDYLDRFEGVVDVYQLDINDIEATAFKCLRRQGRRHRKGIRLDKLESCEQ
ncbi:MAG: hypothetical protein DHS20C01_04520 [marine bacterium B5-7]|nr:MAG: hypothetical protein DHS20C01_04520 [marine bacterium B5-7]